MLKQLWPLAALSGVVLAVIIALPLTSNADRAESAPPAPAARTYIVGGLTSHLKTPTLGESVAYCDYGDEISGGAIGGLVRPGAYLSLPSTDRVRDYWIVSGPAGVWNAIAVCIDNAPLRGPS